MKSSSYFFNKGVFLGLVFLLFAMPVFIFAQEEAEEDAGAEAELEEPETLTIGENSRSWDGNNFTPNDPADYAGVEYEVIDSFSGIQSSDRTIGTGPGDANGDQIIEVTTRYSFVEGRDANQTTWMVEERIDEAGQTITQSWSRLEDGLGNDLEWGQNVANMAGVAGSGYDLQETADFLGVGYEARVHEQFGHDDYNIVNSYIDYDGTGDPDYIAILQYSNGEYRILYHEDMDSPWPLSLQEPENIVNNEETVDDQGWKEELERFEELNRVALANQAIENQQNLEQEIAQLERDLANAQQVLANTAPNTPERAAAQSDVSRLENDLSNARQRQAISQQVISDGARRGNLVDGNANTTFGQDVQKAIFDPLIKEVQQMWQKFVEMLTWLMIQGSSLFLGVAGVALNYTIQELIIEMGQKIQGIGGINIAWTAIRDVMNIFFIFIMLYISGSIILQLNDQKAKEMLKNVIIIAILINFSLFFTKVVIDVANVLTLSLNNSVLQQYETGQTGLGSFNGVGSVIQQTGITGQMMNGLGMGATFKTQNIDPDFGTAFFKAMIVSIFLCITALVFFLITIMLIVRFVILIIVLILSPAAFMGFILPGLKKSITDKWLDALVKNAFFPVVFFLMLTITFKMMESDVFKVNFSPELNPGLGIMAINYIILVGFIIASLLIAKEMGVHGGKMAVSKLTSAGKWATNTVKVAAVGTAAATAGSAYRNSVGRTANRIANNTALQRTGVGRAIARTAQKTADVGGKRSFTATRDRIQKRDKETYDNIGKVHEREREYAETQRKEAEKELDNITKELQTTTDPAKRAELERKGVEATEKINKYRAKENKVVQHQEKFRNKIATRSRFPGARKHGGNEAAIEIQKELDKKKKEQEDKEKEKRDKDDAKYKSDADKAEAKRYRDADLAAKQENNRLLAILAGSRVGGNAPTPPPTINPNRSGTNPSQTQGTQRPPRSTRLGLQNPGTPPPTSTPPTPPPSTPPATPPPPTP